MKARTKTLAKQLAGVAVAAPAIVALGPLAAVIIPFWWRKAAKDGVRAALQDEMHEAGVDEELKHANDRSIADWRAYRNDREFEISRSVTRTRKHPIFGVEGSYTMTRTDYAGR